MPVHTVRVDAFCMSATEITVGQVRTGHRRDAAGLELDSSPADRG